MTSNTTTMSSEKTVLVDDPIELEKGLAGSQSTSPASEYLQESYMRVWLLFVIPASIFLQAFGLLAGFGLGEWSLTQTIWPLLYFLPPMTYLAICWFRFIARGNYTHLLPRSDTNTAQEIHRRRVKEFLKFLFGGKYPSSCLFAANNRLHQNRGSFMRYIFPMLYQIEKDSIPRRDTFSTAIKVVLFLAPIMLYGTMVGLGFIFGSPKFGEKFADDETPLWAKFIVVVHILIVSGAAVAYVLMGIKTCGESGLELRLKHLAKLIKAGIETSEIGKRDLRREAWVEEIWGQWKGDEELERLWKQYCSTHCNW